MEALWAHPIENWSASCCYWGASKNWSTG